MILEKNVLRIICFLLLTALCTSCSNSDEAEQLKNITLSVDKNNFKSNGNEGVTFLVKANGKDITNDAHIIYKEENTPLSGNAFFTNIPGTYTFYATFEGLSSSEIQVNAMPVILILTADTTSIKTNRKSAVTFSATADGVDVTGNVEIFFNNGKSELLLEGNIFTTDQEDNYEFYCKYNDHISNKITIKAIPFTLILKADITIIKANGTEFVNFTVTEDDNDITNDAIIYRKEGDSAIPIESNVFGTTQEGAYDFFAQYQKQTSNPVSIQAEISRLTLTSDKTTAKTGENITFTTISDDVSDVSPDITLHIRSNDNEETIEGNVFTPSLFGKYFIYASYEGRNSNTVEIEVSPANVTLSVNKTAIKSTGADFATFTVSADGKVINDADIYLIREAGDIKINDNKFSSNIQGSFSFYAAYADTKSEITEITVSFVNFLKQSCAMEVVATWCGYSPQLINVFHQIHNSSSDQIQIISVHRSNSDLGSTDFNTEEFMEQYGANGTPFGIIDLHETLPSRSVEAIRVSNNRMKYLHPVTSGIAINSKISDASIDVTLNIKVSETDEYNICAIIVEDNVVKRQTVYLNNSKDNIVHDDNFVHQSVATYIMPNTNLYTGKSLGTIQAGDEVTESFSIPLTKVISKYHTVNHSNCRVIAYVLKKEDDKLFINNTTACPINGSVDYKYEE